MSISSELVGIARTARHRLAVRKASKLLVRSGEPRPSGTFDVLVYFADTEANLYQLRQWFDVLKAVDSQHRVLILTRSADAALALTQDPTNPFPVVLAARHNAIDPFVAAHDPKVVLYVNHHRANFAMMWHPSALHVYIGHGESDKIGISASNQLKAYDFTFVAGQAAIDRIDRRLINFESSQRLLVVGRPQVDVEFAISPRPADLTTVLYAPSWEGDRVANTYGSARTHGLTMVRALIADGSYRVVFRQHPLSGHRDSAYAQACTEIAEAIVAAAKQNPAAGHHVCNKPDFGVSLANADVVVADVSAVALDAVAAGKPVVVTKPSETRALVTPDSVMARFTLLPADEAELVPDWLADAKTGDAAVTIDEIREYCFGDTSRGVATEAFVAAVTKVADLRDELLAQR